MKNNLTSNRPIKILIAISCGAAVVAALIFLAPLPVAATACPSLSPAVQTLPKPWLFFKRDPFHTGVVDLIDGVGKILPQKGPLLRWKYRVFDPPASGLSNQYPRWFSQHPLGDLDGDGTLEVIVTSPNPSGSIDRVIALKDVPNENPPVREMWTFTDTTPNLDMYSPALADADNDGLLDVIFVSTDGHLQVLKGCNKQLLWDYQTQHTTEAGPIVAELYGDGRKQVILTTAKSAALPGNVCYPGGDPTPDCGAVYVFALTTTVGITNHLIFSQTFNYRLDSAVPSIANLDPSDPRKTIIANTWGGVVALIWDHAGTIVTKTIGLQSLDPTYPFSQTAVGRSSPLVVDWDYGSGPTRTIVFGWMPYWNDATNGRISAIGLSQNISAGTLITAARWTTSTFSIWKSSPSLLPVPNPTNKPLVVVGYGIGVGANQGEPNDCTTPTGGIVAFDYLGRVAWHHDYNTDANLAGASARASTSVADMNNDGRLDVLLPYGCFGKLFDYDGIDGTLNWSIQLGPYTYSTPSIGDLNGDGQLEIVIGSLDGYVWALTGGARTYLPMIKK